MKIQHRKSILPLMLLIFLLCFAQYTAAEEHPAVPLMPQPPRFELVLDINELTVLNQSVSDGLNKYGGGIADFELNAAKGDQGTVWKVIIKNSKLPDVLKYWISEKSLALVRTINPDRLTPDDKTALNALKSLADKVDASRNNPVYDEIKISGTIAEENGNVFIRGTGFQYPLTGNHTEAVKEMAGQQVILYGAVKVKNQIEATRALIKKMNTLELFVMSHCPFAQQAETALINLIDTLPDDQRPDIRIRYIFYFKNNKFDSMHGEPEIMENLVQMVIRDDYHESFHPYLLQRSEDKTTPWQELAKNIDLSDEAVQGMEDKIAKERDHLIQTEYNYAALTYGITDGSPAYVWESEIIPDIRQIEIFKDLAFSTEETCAH